MEALSVLCEQADVNSSGADTPRVSPFVTPTSSRQPSRAPSRDHDGDRGGDRDEEAQGLDSSSADLVRGDDLEVRVVETPEYRVARIEVKRGDAIDQIKFVYDDGSEWSCGHNGGKDASGAIILSTGEHITKVVHERFVNHKCAGAAVEFHSSKGRVFGFAPPRMTTGWQSEQVTVEAQPDHEIIGLIVRRGVLLGTQQQRVAPPNPSGESAPGPGADGAWYAIARLAPKEDGDEGSDAPALEHFESLAKAKRRWAQLEAGIVAKAGRAALMIDCMSRAKLKQLGPAPACTECSVAATEAGLLTDDTEEDVSVMKAVLMLVKLVSGEPADLIRLVVTTALLAVSFYFEIEAQLISGHVLAIPAAAAGIGAGAHGVAANSSTPGNGTTAWEQSAYGKLGCDYLVDCTPSERGPMYGLIAAFFAFRLIERFFYVANVYIHHLACETKNQEIKGKAFRHVLSLDQAYFDTHTKSEIRAGMNVHAVNNMITWNIPYLFSLTVQFVMVAASLIRLDPMLGAGCIAALTIIRFGVIEQTAKSEKAFRKMERKLTTLDSQIIDETFESLSTIKLFSTEEHHGDEYDEQQARRGAVLNREVQLRCFREFIEGVLRTGTFAGALVFGLVSSETGLTAPELIGFFSLLRTIMGLFGRIKWHWELMVREYPDIDRFLTLVQAAPGFSNGDVAIEELAGKIEFRNVHFEYPSRPGEKVIKGLNLTIEPNKMTAVVGDSGAGKSTITKLITRLYDPSAGEVLIDGIDARKLELRRFHEQIAVVAQNPRLFNASLAENISYGDITTTAAGAVGSASSESHATRAARLQRVQDAAQLANCQFIDKFRAGLDTFPGAGGGQISGGERQRIAIARAAIRDPKLLILDEATSALDAANEAEVKQALDRLMQGRTTVVIAHRLSTVKNADKILCMKDGEVVESGTHRELMAMCGVYAGLVAHQLVSDDDNNGDYN